MSPAVVVEGIGSSGLVPKPDTGVSWNTLQLGPEEGFVLSRVDGRTTINDICALVPFERTLTEAILWHAGEAQKSRDRFRAMNAADRAALLRFLESL